jgi:putative peptidoglycan lipid II flippase
MSATSDISIGPEPEAPSASLAAAGRATIILTGGAVIVQAIGFLRQVYLAAEVGIDSGLDALLISLALPLALVSVLAGGISVALVPAYIQVREDRGTLLARRLAGTVLVWVAIGGAVLSVVLWFGADAIVAITAPGLAADGTADEATQYLQAFAPLTLISSLTAIIRATCQAERMFRAMVISGVAAPTLALTFMVVFWDSLGLEGLVWGTILGEVLSLMTLGAATLLRRVAPLPRLISRGLGLRELGHHAAPLTVSRGLLFVQQTFDRAVASLLLAGGVSALRYADSLIRLPVSAIAPAYQTAAYPTLVQASRGSGEAGLGPISERLLRYSVAFFVPIAVLTMAVAPLATAIVYDRGAFDQSDLALTARIVALSAPLIVTWTVQPTLVSAMNARRKGMILLAAGSLTTVGNIVLDVVFGLLIGVPGVPLATVVVSIVVNLFLGHQLMRMEPSLSARRFWRTFSRSLAAIMPIALIVAIPMWAGWIDGGFVQRVIALLVSGVAGLGSYYLIARRLGVEEVTSIVAFGSSTIRRLRER